MGFRYHDVTVLRGVLIPIKGAGHAPFLECATDTVAWIRACTQGAALAAVQMVGGQARTGSR